MSWNQWGEILAEAEQFATDERVRVPLSCPNDGEPLTPGPEGSFFCTFDGWRYPHDWHPGQH